MRPNGHAFDPYAILAALDRHGVSYIVIGAFARVIQGTEEITRGIDIVPSLRSENLRRLTVGLEELGAERVDGQALTIAEAAIQEEPLLELDTPSGELKIVPGLEGEGHRFFAGYDGSGNLLGLVIEASDRGYADVISAMYSYNADMRAITGFQVVEMRETPGLGDKIRSDPDFLANFKNLDASHQHPITAVKHGTKRNPWQIDAISGATISSRAVGRALEKSVATVTPVIARNLDRIKRGN